jgi:lipid A ethanolaminephosphotransferase
MSVSSVSAHRPRRPSTSPTGLSLVVSIALVALYNGSFWRQAVAAQEGLDLSRFVFLVSLFLLLVASHLLLLTLLAVGWLQKPVILVVLVLAGVSAYFMRAYGGVIDMTMVQNVLETDTAEVGDLMSRGFVVYLLVMVVPPMLVVIGTRIRRRQWTRELAAMGIAVVSSVSVIVLTIGLEYGSLASLLSNHHDIRHRVTPGNLIVGTYKYLRQNGRAHGAREPLGEDAVLIGAASGRADRELVVLVLGETARASEFSLNGYGRTTNPLLSQRDIINFSDVTACGTTSAISVRCIFSRLGHGDFSRSAAASQEGLLDVLSHAGLDVLWVENNSGCKGVCNGVRHVATPWPGHEAGCIDGRCYDEAMLAGLDDYLGEAEHSVFVVLHQQGSHGPAYHLRYPSEREIFAPACHSSELKECSVEEVVNAYDNTIAYTDYFLDRVIAFLDVRRSGWETGMIYVSDHGESLGENGIYLHGLPYRFAPEDQKKVPLILWLSDELSQSSSLDRECLGEHSREPLSHDNVFDSVLGLMNVRTRVYRPELDIFAHCRDTDRSLTAS